MLLGFKCEINMNKYVVTLTKTIQEQYVVEAEDIESAKAKGYYLDKNSEGLICLSLLDTQINNDLCYQISHIK